MKLSLNPFAKRPSTASGSSDTPAESFLFVTYDSCRYDAYIEAQTPVLDRHVEVRKAFSQATYTYASHASMFQGILPHVFTEEPYYNRFVLQMWRISHRKAVKARVTFDGAKSIVDGFNKKGYFTCATAAMAWFRNNPQLREFWQSYEWTGIDAQRQVNWTKQQLRNHPNEPFFAFINFGETHSPYKFAGQAGLEGDAPARQKGGVKKESFFDEETWRMQVRCVEFLDERMGELLDFFQESKRDVTVVMCGDHGDCFGEDGLYGHGFYHPKVMEVPMGIFDFKA